MTADHPDRATEGSDRLEAILRRMFGPVPDPTQGAADGGEAGGRPELIDLFDQPAALTTEDGMVTMVNEGDAALAGVRSAGLLEGRQVVVEWSDLTVVLDIVEEPGPDGGEPSGDRGEAATVTITGEVIGPAEVLAVQLLDGTHEMALSVTDTFGEFRFEAVPVGRYTLVLAGAHREASIDLDLG